MPPPPKTPALPVQTLIDIAIRAAIAQLVPSFAKQLLPVSQTFVKALRIASDTADLHCHHAGGLPDGPEIRLLGVSNAPAAA